MSEEHSPAEIQAEAETEETRQFAAAAKGSEILVANVVRELAKSKKFVFVDRRDVILIGFDKPVRLFEVRWREED